MSCIWDARQHCFISTKPEVLFFFLDRCFCYLLLCQILLSLSPDQWFCSLACFSIVMTVVMVSTLDIDIPAVWGDSRPVVFQERLPEREREEGGRERLVLWPAVVLQANLWMLPEEWRKIKTKNSHANKSLSHASCVKAWKTERCCIINDMLTQWR